MSPGLYPMLNGQKAVITEVRDGYVPGRIGQREAMGFADGSYATHQETSELDLRRGDRATTGGDRRRNGESEPRVAESCPICSRRAPADGSSLDKP